jgi:hypothetical protein
MKKLIILLSLLCAFASVADDKDQKLTIRAATVDGKTCIADITVTGHDNCKMANGKRGDCEGIPDCVCSKPDKHIEWDSADISAYSVYFYDDSSPFKSNCNLDSNSQGKLKCAIKGDAGGTYDYGVKVAGCDDYDPRIIIK